jgi:hypothetical protein
MTTTRQQALEQAKMLIDWAIDLSYAVTEGSDEFNEDLDYLDRKANQVIEEMQDYYIHHTEKSQVLTLPDKFEKIMDIKER